MRALRAARRLTQVELAARLGLSQGRLSEIERGNGSFTAEQLLLMLGLFNVPASHFVSPTQDPGATLQNALARLGATHLHERSDVVPDERLEELGAVVREALLSRAPRHLTALAPVLVRAIDRVNLPKIRADLVHAGLERRLAWLVDNTLAAVRHELRDRTLPRLVARRYRRAEAVLDVFMDFVTSQAADPSREPRVAQQDLLDRAVASPKTRREVADTSSAISKRWGIITALQVDDFVQALRADHAV